MPQKHLQRGWHTRLSGAGRFDDPQCGSISDSGSDMLKGISKTILITAILVGCAKSPDAIAPVSMSGAYDNISCKQARALLSQEQNKLTVLSSAQSNAVAGDAVGVFLIGVPVSSLSGGDKAGEIAASKGKIEALEARLLTCG